MAIRAHSKARRASFAEEALPQLSALYNFAVTLAGRAEAEDLVQMACVRALEHLNSYRPGTNIRAWLFTILRNEWISRQRHAQRHALGDLCADESVVAELRDEAVDIETLLIQQHWSTEIKAALLALPESYRLPVYLKDVEGFGYREIAEIVCCPLGTVMSRLARGRATLRAALVDQARERGILPGATATESL